MTDSSDPESIAGKVRKYGVELIDCVSCSLSFGIPVGSNRGLGPVGGVLDGDISPPVISVLPDGLSVSAWDDKEIARVLMLGIDGLARVVTAAVDRIG